MQLTKESEALLAALRSDATTIVHTALAPTVSTAEHPRKSKGAVARLQELVQAWPNRAKEDLGQAILHQVKVCLAKFHDTAEQDSPSAEEGTENVEEVLLSLVGLVKIVAEEANGNLLSSVQEAARHLHDQAILMADGAAELQEAVVRLCCLWWQKELPGKADMVPQMIPYLLYQATVSGKAADVKRCYSMRGTLALLDFEDPSIQGVQALMVRGAMLPAFLRCADGRKFIAHLFTLHPKMVYELTAVILNQIVSGRKSVLEAYGEIVFKAWRAATGACLERIETHLIQNSLIRSALRASSPALAASLRHVLEGLHSQRLTPGTDAMLLRLYHPLLFRDLAAANASVRNNALQLLVDAFPLQDSAASAEESDELLQRQFEELSKGLQDEAPAVRVTASLGICSLLNMYWELMPAGTTAAYLKRLTEDVACDSSSPGVRLAVVQGLGGLVDNPLAQPLLKMVLPKLGPLLHDKALKVRTAVAGLLLAVMRVRELHFVDIVDVEQLLQAMAHDAPQVAHRIQKLLLPSYFPDSSEGPARVAALLRQNPPAGKAFCTSLCQALPAQQTAELIAALRDHLLSYAPPAAAAEHGGPDAAAVAAAAAVASKGSKRRRGRKQNSADAQASEEGQQESPEGWQALLAGLVELCAGLATAVASDPDEAALLQGLFHADALLQLLELCGTALSRELVMHMAQAMPSAEASIAVQARCVEQLLALSEHDTMSDSELASLMRCALVGSSRRALVDALVGGLHTGQDQASPKTCLHTALRCLDLGLQDPQMRDALLSEDQLQEALALLRPDAGNGPMHALMRAAEALPDCLDGVDSQAGLQGALHGRAHQGGLAPMALVLYNRIALHLQLTAVSINRHEHPERADTTALPSVARAVASIQIRQSSAERDVYAEQHQAAPAAAFSGVGPAEAAAEGAVVTSCEVVQKLLQQLEGLGTPGVMAIMASTDVIEPQRKKGRKGSRQGPDAAPALRPCDCIQAAFKAAQGALAVGGDAARVLQWGAHTPAAQATFSLAVAIMLWSKNLREVNPDFTDTCVVMAISLVACIGGNPQHGLEQTQAPAPDPRQPDRHADSDSQMATQLYQAADSAASLQGCSTNESDGRCTGVEAVAEAVMQQGCWDEEGRAVQLMKPFLPAALLALTQAHACRWLQPLAHLIGSAMEAQLSIEDESPKGRPQQSPEAAGFSHGRQHGHDRLEGSPSMRGCGGGESQALTQLNDQPQADDADSHQVDKENVSVNQAAALQQGGTRGKPQVIAESFHMEHSLLTAILAAAETAQVNESLAEAAARTAAQAWHRRDVVSSLGALKLIQMLGFPAHSSRSCRHSKQRAVFDRAAAHLRQLHDTIAPIATSSEDVALSALQRQLQALLVH